MLLALTPLGLFHRPRPSGMPIVTMIADYERYMPSSLPVVQLLLVTIWEASCSANFPECSMWTGCMQCLICVHPHSRSEILNSRLRCWTY